MGMTISRMFHVAALRKSRDRLEVLLPKMDTIVLARSLLPPSQCSGQDTAT